MTFLSTAAATAALVVLGAGAQAATYDFGGLADGVGEGEWGTQAANPAVAGGSYAGGDYTVDGVSVSATGYEYSVDGVFYDDGFIFFTTETYSGTNAYLDGTFDTREGGLGVCLSIPVVECDPSNDDNVGSSGAVPTVQGMYEFVTLTFDVLVQFTDFVFRDDNHNVITDGAIGLSIDDPNSPDMMFAIVDISNLASVIDDHDLVSKTWSFARVSDYFCGVHDTVLYEEYRDIDFPTNCVNFYIDGATVSQIPIPAAGWLLIAGVGGLAAMRRRKS